MSEKTPSERAKRTIDDISKEVLDIETNAEIGEVKIHIRGKGFLYMELGERFKLLLNMPRFAASKKFWGVVSAIAALVVWLLKR